MPPPLSTRGDPNEYVENEIFLSTITDSVNGEIQFETLSSKVTTDHIQTLLTPPNISTGVAKADITFKLIKIPRRSGGGATRKKRHHSYPLKGTYKSRRA